MDASEINSSRGYGKPPWIFKGSALYQLHLVKAETARAFIPKEFRLVEAFGYTLGGFFLANYEESPAGIFDELVVIAGIVWNPPTSCAWAARVLVNSDKACLHGQKDVGLPSRVANFTKSVRALPVSKRSRFGCFMNKIGISDSMEKCLDVQVEEMNNHTAMDLCSIKLTSAASQKDAGRWMGPEIKMSLPSFSGRTEHNPHLLKYSCQIGCRFLPSNYFTPYSAIFSSKCFVSTMHNLLIYSTSLRVRAVSPAKVYGPFASNMDGESTDRDSGNEKRDLSISVMLSKPILALEFNCLQMKVEAPTIVPQEKHG